MPINIDIEDVRKLDKKIAEKDWTGNKKSVFIQLGANGHAEGERGEHDFYATNQHDFRRFLLALKRDGLLKEVLKQPIWEPCCGVNHLAEVLEKLKAKVVTSDLVDRRDWEVWKPITSNFYVCDFLNDDPPFEEFNTILTNPPFKYISEMVERGMELLQKDQWLVFLARIQFLEGKQRYAMFQRYPYRYVYSYTGRANCTKNAMEDQGWTSAAHYCWILWNKSDEGKKLDPILRFIP